MQRKTNVEFVTELMEFSSTGALMQMFIIEAIRSYADFVHKDTSVWPENSIINQDAWKRCAEEILQKLEERSKQ